LAFEKLELAGSHKHFGQRQLLARNAFDLGRAISVNSDSTTATFAFYAFAA